MAQDRTPLPNRQLTCWRNVIADTIARFGKTLHGVKAVGTGRQRKEYQYVVFNIGEKVIECTWHEDDNYIRFAVMHGIDESQANPTDETVLSYVIRILNERYLMSLPDYIKDTRSISSRCGENIYTARIAFYKIKDWENNKPTEEEKLSKPFLCINCPADFTREMLVHQQVRRTEALSISDRHMQAIVDIAARRYAELLKSKKEFEFDAEKELLRAYHKFCESHRL